MKEKLVVLLLCLAFVMPVYMAGAQEDEAEGAAVTEQAAPEKKAESATATEQAAPEKKTEGAAVKKPAAPSNGTVADLIGKAIAFISQIGGVFGSRLGFRIGGTTGTALVTLLIAKLVQDRAPSWVKYLLYLTGGTMLTGSGANIAQMVMGGNIGF
jgi:hypothetical protein